MKQGRFILILLLSLFFISCNPFISKELRQKNRCNRKLLKLTEKCPELLQEDTILIEVPKIEIDTFFNLVADTSAIDSIFSSFKEVYLDSLDKNTLKQEIIRYIKEKPCQIKDTLLLQFDGNTIRLWVEGNKLKYHYKKDPIEIPVVVDVVKPIELTFTEKILSKFGPYFLWLLLIILALFIIFRVFKIKI